MVSNLRSMSSSMRRMPEPPLPSPAPGAALFGVVGSGGGTWLTWGVGVGEEGNSRGGFASADATSASASVIEPGLPEGVDGGLENGPRAPAPGRVERRGGGGGRDREGGEPAMLGRGA